MINDDVMMDEVSINDDVMMINDIMEDDVSWFITLPFSLEKETGGNNNSREIHQQSKSNTKTVTVWLCDCVWYIQGIQEVIVGEVFGVIIPTVVFRQ